MASSGADRRAAVRHVATFRIRLGYADVDTFLSGYAVNISRGGIYVPTKQPKEKGTEVRFEILLKDGSVAVSGVGRVAWARPFNPANPGTRYGMGVQFMSLEGASDNVVQQALQWRDRNLPSDEAGREIHQDDAAAAEPAPGDAPAKAEPAAAAAEEKSATPPKESKAAEPAPAETPAGTAAQTSGLARKVLGDRRVSVGSVDDLLASIKTGKAPAAKPPASAGTAPKPALKPAKPAVKPAAPAPEPAAPAPEPAAPAPEPAAPVLEPAAPVPEPSAASAATDEFAPTSRFALPEAAPKASVGVLDEATESPRPAGLSATETPPPSAPSAWDLPEPALPSAAQAPVEPVSPPPLEPAPEPAPDDSSALDLPAWDDEPVQPLSSSAPRVRRPSSIPPPGSRIIEATDGDLDIDSLPTGVAGSSPLGELFGGAPAEPVVPAAPAEPAISFPEPSAVRAAELAEEAALRASALPAPSTEAEAPELSGLPVNSAPPEIVARPSLADLPPPPDMPAPIPTASQAPDKKKGFFGKLFGKKG